jgi:hypothetical protein
VRYWTVDEANEELPRVRAIVHDVRAVAATATDETARVSGNGSHGGTGQHAAGAAGERIRDLLGDLDADGIVVRDPDRGLVDFIARAPSGREYWLCWLVDEPEITWWHWPEDGFAGRTPLSTPPE